MEIVLWKTNNIYIFKIDIALIPPNKSKNCTSKTLAVQFSNILSLIHRITWTDFQIYDYGFFLYNSHRDIWGWKCYSRVENTYMMLWFHKKVIRAHQASLSPPLFIEVSVPSQESEHVVMYLCVRGINVAFLCMIVLLDFVIVPFGWFFFFSLYYHFILTIPCNS